MTENRIIVNLDLMLSERERCVCVCAAFGARTNRQAIWADCKVKQFRCGAVLRNYRVCDVWECIESNTANGMDANRARPIRLKDTHKTVIIGDHRALPSSPLQKKGCRSSNAPFNWLLPFSIILDVLRRTTICQFFCHFRYSVVTLTVISSGK